MTHYATMVIFDPHEPVSEELLEKKLQPFNENVEVDAYQKTCFCVGRKAKHVAETKTPAMYGKNVAQLRETFMQQGIAGEWHDYIRPFEELKKSIEQQHPLYQKPDENCQACSGNGFYLATDNPQSKFDSYEIGGKWAAFLRLKNGDRTDSAFKKDIDFLQMQQDNKLLAKQEWDKAQAFSPADQYRLFGIQETDTLDTYVKRRKAVFTFSVLLPDGTWHEQPDPEEDKTAICPQEWQTTFYDRFIQPLNDEAVICLIDCHV